MLNHEIYNLDKTCAFLKQHDNYIILCHFYPDGDTIGCAFALCRTLQKIGKKAKVQCAHAFPDKFSYITDIVSIDEIDEPSAAVIAVDVADPKLLGDLNGVYGERTELCIDHHFSHVEYAKRLLLDSDAAAACEIIYKVIVGLGVEMDKDLALALYTGISTDTGCFKFSNTTAETHRIAADLIETGIDSAEINRIMFDTKSRPRVEIERLALDSMQFFFNDRCAVVTITKEMRESSGCSGDDLEGITGLSRSIEGVIAGMTMRERDNGTYKISLRTHAPIDAAAICKKAGGGGHVRAAGCELSGSAASTRDIMLAYIKEALDTLIDN